MHTTLISPAQLQAELASVVLIDCRSNLLRPAVGREEYAAGHIPGARYAELDADLSGPKTPHSGRHPLPDPTVLAATLSDWGIDNRTQVVAYDADTGAYAARLWWLLRWLGHDAVAVLDGGYQAWLQASLPITAEVPAPRAAHFVGLPRDEMVVTAAAVAERVGQGWRLLDARAPERFRGDVEPIDPVAGHVRGAHNHPFTSNLNAGRFLPATALTQSFLASLDGVAAERSMAMCGSGVTACHNLLAMEVAGLSGAKLYAGSWSEWIRDPRRAVARGG